MTKDNSKGGLLPLVGLTLSAFVFNTSEFVPIGLLTDIAKDFRITEADAGMLISVYAWMVMLLSLPLMVVTSRMNLRNLMLWVVGLFSVFQAMSFMSTSYGMLMASRIGVACSHSIFWSIVSPIAVKIVPENRRQMALSMIVTGTSVAMIFGLPLGRVIGLHVGWRMTFLSIGIVSFLTLIYLALTLPKVQSEGGFSFSQLPSLLRNRCLTGIFILSLAFATAYYTGYSYIEPFLKQIAMMPDGLVTSALMIFGGACIVGSLMFSKYYIGKWRYPFLTVTLTIVALCLALLWPASCSATMVVATLVLWGAAVTAFNVAMQSEIINIAPPAATSVAMSIFSGIFNLGIGSGALIGGLVCTHISIAGIGIAGAVIAVFALAFWLLNLRIHFKKLQR